MIVIYYTIKNNDSLFSKNTLLIYYGIITALLNIEINNILINVK